MDDEQDRSFCVGEGSQYIYGSLPGFDLDPKSYMLFYNTKQDPRLDPQEHLLARLTPGEVRYMEYLCRYPERTDAEVMRDLGLSDDNVKTFFTHLYRNFKISTPSEFRAWAIKNRLVRIPDDAATEDLPEVDMPEDDGPDTSGPDKSFNPWARWY